MGPSNYPSNKLPSENTGSIQRAIPDLCARNQDEASIYVLEALMQEDFSEMTSLCWLDPIGIFLTVLLPPELFVTLHHVDGWKRFTLLLKGSALVLLALPTQSLRWTSQSNQLEGKVCMKHHIGFPVFFFETSRIKNPSCNMLGSIIFHPVWWATPRGANFLILPLQQLQSCLVFVYYMMYIICIYIYM